MTDTFALAYREQQQLFMTDSASICTVLLNVGGLASLTAQALVQYFYLPWLATTITWLLAFICAVCFFWPGRKHEHALATAPFAIAAALFIPFASSDNALHYDAFTAYTFAALAYAAVSNSKSIILHLVTIAALFLAAGPACIPYALCICLKHIVCERKTSSLLWLAYPLTATALCTAGFLCGNTGTLPQALGPGFFYETTSQVPASITVLWFLMPAVGALASAPLKKTHKLAVGGAIMLAAAVYSAAVAGKLTSEQQLAEYKYEYYASRQMWPELEKASSRHMNRYIDANYHNLAKACQGKLADQLFTVAQHTPSSLFYDPSNHTSDPRMARVLLAMGNVPGAQSVAFNALQSNAGLNPELLKMLVKIEFMRGNHAVAQKYLSRLQRAPHYKAWAEQYSRFLYNDDLILSDAELATGRANLESTGSFVLNPSPMYDMLKILEASQTDWGTVQYALSYLLLSKDFQSVYELVDSYYGKGAFTRLPRAAQEAVLFFSDYYHTTSKNYAVEQGIAPEKWEEFQAADADWCMAHGVTENTVKDFLQFKRSYTSGQANAATMGAFKNTFWYYLLYEKI